MAHAHTLVREFEAKQMKPASAVPDFRPGDTLRVAVRIKEGEKERAQAFEGVCIRRNGSGFRETFTVRRVTFGVGVERIFPVHSPYLEDIKVIRRGDVRRAKLYYLRELEGKKARIREALTADGVPVAIVEADQAREGARVAAAQAAESAAAAAAETAAAQTTATTTPDTPATA